MIPLKNLFYSKLINFLLSQTTGFSLCGMLSSFATGNIDVVLILKVE